jgi:hypothetical protein
MDKNLDTLVANNAQTLYKISGLFPFTLFPSTMVIDKTKIHLHQRYFPFGTSVRTIAIKDISSVIVQTAFFLASVRVVNKFFLDEPLVITHVPHYKARKASKILDGLIVASREGVDILDPSMENVSQKLEVVGSSG